MASPAGAAQRLMSEYKGLQKEKWVSIELKDGSFFNWSLALMVVNPESVFNGGYFRAEMTFDAKYPYSPPTFKFLHPIHHPNIYADGKICISILHPPGEDEQSGETAMERWSPLQGVESVLRSVLLLLDDPEINSPANVDAAKVFRDDRDQYNKLAKETVQLSKKDVPAGFTMPTTLETAPPADIDDDDGCWAESDLEEEDWGASDSSDNDMDQDEDEDREESEEDGDDTVGAK